MNVLAGERKLGYRLHDHVGGARCRVADLHGGREQCKVDELPAVDRKVFNLPRLDDGADACPGGLGKFGGGLDGHLLFHFADAQGEVQVGRLRNLQHDGPRFRTEALGLDGHGVFAGRQRGDCKISRIRSLRGTGKLGGVVRRRDGGFRHHAAGRIRYSPTQRGGDQLPVGGPPKGHDQSNQTHHNANFSELHRDFSLAFGHAPQRKLAEPLHFFNRCLVKA